MIEKAIDAFLGEILKRKSDFFLDENLLNKKICNISVHHIGEDVALSQSTEDKLKTICSKKSPEYIRQEESFYSAPAPTSYTSRKYKKSATSRSRPFMQVSKKNSESLRTDIHFAYSIIKNPAESFKDPVIRADCAKIILHEFFQSVVNEGKFSSYEYIIDNADPIVMDFCGGFSCDTIDMVLWKRTDSEKLSFLKKSAASRALLNSICYTTSFKTILAKYPRKINKMMRPYVTRNCRALNIFFESWVEMVANEGSNFEIISELISDVVGSEKISLKDISNTDISETLRPWMISSLSEKECFDIISIIDDEVLKNFNDPVKSQHVRMELRDFVRCLCSKITRKKLAFLVPILAKYESEDLVF